MELLILILNRPESLQRAVSALQTVEVNNITVLDSESLGQFIGESGEDDVMSGAVGLRRSASHTIVGAIRDRDEFEEIRSSLLRNEVDLDSPGEALLLTLPIRHISHEW
ncbi:MAG: hypothetical protein GF344_14505 [Chitinivibrionales bacterium]|nr:hypothetical protein [Chitinivibrionales bacterium]MBD3357935.1 hypothetical protein [Chitinivibrionales bacterium]